MVCKAELQVVEVEVETAKDDADRRVQRLTRSNGGIILLFYGTIQSRIRAADVRDVLAVELGFNAPLT